MNKFDVKIVIQMCSIKKEIENEKIIININGIHSCHDDRFAGTCRQRTRGFEIL